jgi:hypothetical protein
LPELAQDARFVAMFCDEARISAPLTHPNIVQVIDFGESQGELFMAMEYVEGVSLAKLLRYVSGRRERFPLAAALFIAHEVLTGLAFAHSACDENGNPLHIVHRDVSPGNVLIGRAGDVKLADFGIVRSAYVDRRTYPGELKGKVGYMSPEQVMGVEVDPRSDLFTVGIILSEMLMARPLFSGQNEFDILTKIYEGRRPAAAGARRAAPGAGQGTRRPLRVRARFRGRAAAHRVYGPNRARRFGARALALRAGRAAVAQRHARGHAPAGKARAGPRTLHAEAGPGHASHHGRAAAQQSP